MSYPTKYTRQYDYSSYQNANPTRPLPADKVNADLNLATLSIDEIVEFLKASHRSDGLLANESVGRDQLAFDILASMSDPAALEEAIEDTEAAAAAAAASASAASASATTADTKATAASASATAASGSASAASSSASAASGSAASAAGSALAAAAAAAQIASVTPQVRLSLTSGVAVMTTDVAGATTVYCVPCGGNLVPIYNGTVFVPTAVVQMSQTTTDTTKSPAAVGASLIYDMYVWDDVGNIRCTRGPARASDSTAPAITYVNGIALNTSAITNGPAAQRGTWVGCVRSNASSTIDVKFGTSASGGGQAWFGVANAYNLTTAVFNVIDTTASWTSAGGTTVRPFNNSSTNRVSVLSCSGTAALSTQVHTRILSTASNFGNVLIGLNSTTSVASGSTYGLVAGAVDGTTVASYNVLPATGFGYIQALEAASNTSQTFVGNGIYSKLTGFWQW